METGEDGLPGFAHTAHLIPENPEGRYWLILDPRRPAEMDLDFTAFITALEGEFAKRQTTRKVEAVDRAILVRVETKSVSDGEASIAELRELCRTAGVEVFDAVIQHRSEVDPRYLIGKGKLSNLVIRALQMDANLLIFDHELSAAQIRSIADSTELKVIDRTQVILDIFAKRAHSREGKIQVELAQLKYRLPRLTQQDAGLSRLTGGIGGTGPGETKLEVDRRRLRDRIHHLEKDLKNIEKARGQRRGRRDRAGLPIISIGVIGQRLLRRICDSCKEPYTPGADELAVFRQHSGGSDKSQFFHGAGCNYCAGTGYRDRIGVYELLRITPELRRLIVGWATTEELRRLAVAQGMRTMLREGMALVENDVTTVPEVVQTLFAS